MGRHGARDQRKLAKKKAKRLEKQNRLARQFSNDPTIRLAEAHRWPIIEALIPDNLWECGLGTLIIARQPPQSFHTAFASFLIDIFCLGVKDAFWKIIPETDYQELVDRIEENAGAELCDYDPAYFSKVVHCAADYAQSLGFPVNPDFRHARRMLDGIDPSLCPDILEFGRDGKPFYVRGPNESLEKARWIGNRVRELGGDYVIPLTPPTNAFDIPEIDVLETDDEGFEDEPFFDDTSGDVLRRPG